MYWEQGDCGLGVQDPEIRHEGPSEFSPTPHIQTNQSRKHLELYDTVFRIV
jgi:hypothetical protein